METTVKNVGLSPINRGEVQKYTAKQSPAYKQEFWDKFAETNDLDYYMYVLNQADAKGIGIDNINFEGLDDNVDDQWAEFYKEVLADDTEVKDYGEDYGQITEKQYLTKVLDQKREYIAWVKEEEKIAAEKEAMSGWEKFWAGVGHFFVNVGYTIEQSVLSIFDFVTNWDSDGEPAGWLKPWADNLEERKMQLADWERRYSYRDVKTWDTGFGATMLLGAANTIGLMLPAFIANKIHPGAGMYVMYGTMFTNNVYEARNTPGLTVSEGEIILRAILQTGVEILIEKALGPSMLDDVILNAGRAGREFVKVTTINGLKILGKEILHEATEEFLQELGSAMVNMIMAVGNEEWQKFNSENLAQDLGIAALLGGLFAGARIVVPSLLMEPIRAIGGATGHLKAGNVIADTAKAKVDTKATTETETPEADTSSKPKPEVETETDAKPEVETETPPSDTQEENSQTYHRMNMFERLAMQTNLQTFFDNINKAVKENKKGQKKLKKGKEFNLDMDLRDTLHAQAVELGQIFQGMDASQMETSMQLLNKVHEYAKTEGAKQNKILMGDKLYLEALTTELDAAKKAAMAKYWEQKGKKATAKKLKKARVSKLGRVIDKDNVEEEVENLKNEKDEKNRARERVIEDTVREGLVIVTTDGNEVVVAEDMVFIPQRYLENGNPSEILRDTVEKDLARQFVEFMKDPRRMAIWAEAKAALIKAFPEMGTKTERIRAARWAALTEEQQKEYKPSKTGKTYTREVDGYSDEDIARNLLFTKGGAYALIKNLPNSQFNILFLNMLEGLKDVVYKTKSYEAAQKETIHTLELNFRYAARMYCLDNLGINPHDLHNVLTKVDQMYIKEERAKAEAKIHEDMRQIAHTSEAAPHYITEEELFDPNSPQGQTLTQFQETAEKKFNSTDGSKIVDKFGALREQIRLTLDYFENGAYDVYEAVNYFMESWFEEDWGFSENTDYQAVLQALVEGKPFPAEPFIRGLKAFNLEENGTEDIEPEFIQEYLDPIAEEYKAVQEQVNALENPLYPLALLEYIRTPVFMGDESGRVGSDYMMDTIMTMIEKTPWLFENVEAITAYRGVKVKGNNTESATKFLADLRKAKIGDSITFNDEGKVMPISLDVNTARGFTGEDINGTMSDGILFTIVYTQQDGVMTPMGKGEAELLVKGGLTYKILDVNSSKTQYLLQAIYDTNSRNEIERVDVTPTEQTEEQVLAEGKQSLMEDDQGSLSGAKFTTPEYENKSYKDFRQYLLKPSLSTLEADSVTLEDVIKNPEAYLKPKVLEAIKNDFGDASENSVYRWLRQLFIEDSKGKKSIVRSEDGKKYYFADVRSVKKWNNTSITEKVKNDPEGNSLIEEYKGRTVSAKEFFRGEALVGLAGDTQIEFKEGGGNYYSANQNKIYIDTTSKLVKTNQQFLFAINHEFQHALQSTNRTAGGFTTGLKLPTELVAAVEAEFPERFKKDMTAKQKNAVANRIIYEFSGELEANLHSTKYKNVDDYPGQFIVAVEGDNYVITTPSGAGPYRVAFKDKAPKSSMANRSAKGSRGVSKKSAKGTNLEYLTIRGKKLRIDPEAKAFVENSRLELLEDDVAAMITSGDLRTKAYQKLMKWFKTTNGMNEYTFQQFKKAFWPDSNVDSFRQLTEITTGLTFDLDEKGNWHEVKFRGPKGEEFSINDDAYRRAVMEYYVDNNSLAEIRRIVASTEILRREINFSNLAQTDDEGEVKDFDPAALGDFTEAVLNNTTRIKKEHALMKMAHRQILAKAAGGKLTLEETRAQLAKYNEDYFGNLTDDELDTLYLKMTLKAQNLKVKEAAINKALQRNRKNAIANIKRLGTTIWNNTTPKNRPRLPKKIAQWFTEDGHIKPEVYQGKSQLDIVGIENLLKEVAYKARRGAYATDETTKIFEQLEAYKKKVEDLKAQKNKKTQTVNTTGVVTEYRTNIKTEVKTIQVKTTKAKIPPKLEQMLGTNFNQTRMSQIKEMENFEYHVAEKEVFRQQNQEILDSLTEGEWIEIIEWYEQSEFVGTEDELGLYKAIRLYILSDLVGRIKTHNIVMDNTWVNRVRNIITKNVHGSAVEVGVYGQVLDTLNPYRQIAEEYAIPEEDLDELEEAFKSGTDEELAAAIDQIKADIAENYVEKGLMEKLLAFRYTAMLSGPMTWFRNLVSNYIVKYFNKLAATVGHKLGGKRLSGYNGYTLVGTKVSSEVARFIKENLLDTGLLHQLMEGYSKYDPYKASKSTKTDVNYIVRTLVENFNKQFEADHLYGDPEKNKMAKLFTKFSSFVRKMISDDKFVNEATSRYFGKMLTEDIEAGRIKADELSKGVFNKTIIAKFADAQWLAMNDYMKNTNFMTKAMSALNENKFARYIIPIIAPFAQSSWNWWVETMRYSPFGLIQSVTRLLKFEKYVQKMNEQRDSSVKGQSASVQSAMLDKYMVTRNLGKGVIGTFFWATGIILAATGVIGLSRRNDSYVLTFGGGTVEINLDNVFGSSSLLAGAALVSCIKDGQWTKMLSVTLDQMAKTLFLTDILSTFEYGSVGEYMMSLPFDLLRSFIPSFIKTFSNNVQIYKVKYDSGILGQLERFANDLIPGVSYAFKHEIDPYTGKKRFYKIPILTQFGGISYNDISEVERECIKYGISSGQFGGEITIDGKKYKLDKTKVMTYKGEYVNQFVTALINDEVAYKGKKYSKMTKEEKEGALKSAINKANNYAKIRAWTEEGNKYYAGKDLYIALKSLRIQNVFLGSGGYVPKSNK